MTRPDSGPVIRESAIWPYIGVGCFTFVIGFFGGGMIAALVAKIVGAMRGCVPPEGFPACNTWSFVLPGAVLGAVLLPSVAIRRLRQGRRAAERGPDTTS